MLKIDTSWGSMFRCIKLNGFEINSYSSITSISSFDDNLSMLFWGKSRDCFRLLKVNMSWLIVINNSDSSSSIMTRQLIIVGLIEQLNEKIFIRLPVVIINNFNFNEFLSLALIKRNNLITSYVIVSSLGLCINSLNSDSCSIFFLVNNHHL